jgi:hypothetical protein
MIEQQKQLAVYIYQKYKSDPSDKNRFVDIFQLQKTNNDLLEKNNQLIQKVVYNDQTDEYFEKAPSYRIGLTAKAIKFLEDEDKIMTDNNDLTKMTDEELENIVRRNVNSGVPGSLHNKALLEIDLRHKKKLESLERPATNIGILSIGDKNKFKDNKASFGNDSKKEWYEKPLGIIIIGIIIALIAGFVLYKFGWN